MLDNREVFPLIAEELGKLQPDYLYEGLVPEDNDALDYLQISIKGARVA